MTAICQLYNMHLQKEVKSAPVVKKKHGKGKHQFTRVVIIQIFAISLIFVISLFLDFIVLFTTGASHFFYSSAVFD